MRSNSEELVPSSSLAAPQGLAKSMLTTDSSSLVQRFLLVAGSSTAMGFVLIYSLLFAGFGPEGANFISYAITIPLSYVAHARISFQRRKIKIISFWKYVLTVVLSYSLNFAVLVGLTKFASIGGYWAQIPAFAAYGLLFFCLNRLFVFAERPAC